MIIEDYFQKIKRTFKAKCLIKTELHEVGDIYNVITFAKENSYIYVEDKIGHSHITFNNFFEFLEKFEIV